MTRRILAFVLVVLGLGGLLTWALWGKFEWVEQDRWVGYSGEAKINDFLAVQRLLDRLGQSATSYRGFPNSSRLLGPEDVVILPNRRVRMSPGQAKELLTWVHHGGLLITEGLVTESRSRAESQDPLFRALGVRRVHFKNPGQDESIDYKKFSEENRDTHVSLRSGQFKVRFDPWSELLDLHGKAVLSAGNGSGTKLLQYDLDLGRVIVCTNLDCFANPSIGQADHAAFVSSLATEWSPRNHVWIVYREEPPSLWLWLKTHAWMILLALGITVCFMLWHLMPRFGPSIPDPLPHRRSLLEHLLACGRFQWKQGEGRTLLRAARNDTLARIHRAHPGWVNLHPDERCRHLANFSGLPEDRVFRCLRYDILADSRDFTEAIQTLDLIRKKL